MKRFSELITTSEPLSTLENTDSIQSENTLNSEIIEQSTTDDMITNSEEPVEKFPEYMITHSNIVGYETNKDQYINYMSAAFGTVITGIETVLDVGCGRGDFGDYLLSRHPNVKYTGIDLNKIMIDLGNHKYSDTYSTNRYYLQHGIFDSNFKTDQKYDYVYHIHDLSLNYGVWPDLYVDNLRYEYLKTMILKSLEICNSGVVFMLFNDSTESNSHISFELSPISKIMYELNLKFAIDNTDIPNTYKLLILKNQF